MKNQRLQSGFSLVELTIVVVILGVLAMFGVPKYRTVVETAKASEGLVFMKTVEAQQAGFQAWRIWKASLSFKLGKVATPSHGLN